MIWKPPSTTLHVFATVSHRVASCNRLTPEYLSQPVIILYEILSYVYLPYFLNVFIVLVALVY